MACEPNVVSVLEAGPERGGAARAQAVGCEMAPRAVLALLLCFHSCLCEYSSTALSLHIDTLLATYDREAPPARPVAVAVALDVRHVSVEEDAHMLLLADLKMSWRDSRLVWNASEWEGDSVLVGGERLWTPDVELRSAGRSRGAGGGGGRAVRARVSAAGRVSHVERLELRAPLDLQLAAWPRDTQEATFMFASRTYTLDDLDLQPCGNKSHILTESGWTLTDITYVRVTWTSAEGAQASGAAFTLRAERRGAAMAVAADAVLTAALLLLAAACARPYANRLPLAAASALVSALWLVSVMMVLPGAGAGGSSTPHIVRVTCGACCAAALAALCAALAQAVSRRASEPPAALRALLSKLSALHSITPNTEAGCERGAWAAAAALLDAALAALLGLAMFLMVLVYLLA